MSDTKQTSYERILERLVKTHQEAGFDCSPGTVIRANLERIANDGVRLLKEKDVEVAEHNKSSDRYLTISITFDPPLEQVEAALDRLRDKMRMIGEEIGQAMERFTGQMQAMSLEMHKLSRRGGRISKEQAFGNAVRKDSSNPLSQVWNDKVAFAHNEDVTMSSEEAVRRFHEALALKQVQHPMDADELVGFLNRVWLKPLTGISVPVVSKDVWTQARARITVCYVKSEHYTDEGLSKIELWLNYTVRPRIVFPEGDGK